MANSFIDNTALFRLGYGLYVLTTHFDNKDNGMIINTVSQVTSQPLRVTVTINKENYSHKLVSETKKMNICCLSESAPFSVFERFGFASGLNTNKFNNIEFSRSENGLAYLNENCNAFLSLEVEEYVDLGSHSMFICSVTEAKILSDEKTMSYQYYHDNVKPRPATQKKKGFICKICGYVYEGETLPPDFICPICKHGAEDFEPIE